VIQIINRCLVCVSIITLLADCAIQPVSSVDSILHPASRLDVLELLPSMTDDSLHRVFHPDEKKVSPDVLAGDKYHYS